MHIAVPTQAIPTPLPIHPLITTTRNVSMGYISSEDGTYRQHEFEMVNSEDQAWIGKLTKADREDYPTVGEINQYLVHVEDSRVHPEVSASTTVAPDTLQNVWIKGPKFGHFLRFENTTNPDWVMEDFQNEISIMEQIKPYPHPNFVTYHGCRVRRGRVTGLVFDRIPRTLTEALPDIDIVDIPTIFAEIQSAVDHLRSLVLAHNDINPNNIMIKDDGRPVLIDFGSSAPPEKRIHSSGTRGFCDGNWHMSEVRSDVYSMKKLWEWLESGGKWPESDPGVSIE